MQDDSNSSTFISAHDFDILRNAFRSSVTEGQIAKSRWIQHARDLVRELTGDEDADETLVARIIGR